MKLKSFKNPLAYLFIAFSAVLFSACGKDNDVEDVIEDTKDAAGDAADEVGDAAREAADEVKDATN